jgi:hypothetical protein
MVDYSGIILGIMGHSGVGKDTMADRLIDKHGFVKMGLADEIKRLCKRIYDFSDLQLWGPSEERNKPDLRYPIPGKGHLSPRVALQVFGTEGGRACYPNTWIDLTLRNCNLVLKEGKDYNQKEGVFDGGFWRRGRYQGVVIPDVRFKNELDAIHAAGGYVVRLKRAGAEGNVGVKGHASEEEQKSIMDHECDFVLNVPEGFSNFYAEIDALMQKVPKVSLRAIK